MHVTKSNSLSKYVHLKRTNSGEWEGETRAQKSNRLKFPTHSYLFHYSITPFLTFTAFAQPFHLNLWFTIEAFLIFLLVFLKMATRSLRVRDSFTLILYSIMMEQDLRMSKIFMELYE